MHAVLLYYKLQPRCRGYRAALRRDFTDANYYATYRRAGRLEPVRS